ncbi:MAG TPA: hypothetical protein VJM14_06850 [Burkholderiales bacterium]|nr:hypothetical protein [Burkholderiales bacterium]
MLRCQGDIRLTRAEKRRLRILTGIDPETIRTEAALKRLIDLRLWRYPGDSVEEKLLRAFFDTFRIPD